MSEKLNAGARFPALDLQLQDGGRLRVPEDLETRFTVVLFYRGHW